MPQLTEKLDRAIHLATTQHAGQVDQSGHTYILHPLRVMLKVLQTHPTDYDLAVAAVLHDVVEDTPVTAEQIRSRFGHAVADAVDLLTRREDQSYGHYLEALSRNSIAILVKMADLEDNMRPGYTAKQFVRYDAALAYLRSRSVWDASALPGLNVRLPQLPNFLCNTPAEGDEPSV